METRRWHAAYPPGMGTDIELPPGETLAAMLDRSIAAFADRTAVTAGTESLSYAELGRLAHRLAAHFHAAGLRQEVRSRAPVLFQGEHRELFDPAEPLGSHGGFPASS